MPQAGWITVSDHVAEGFGLGDDIVDIWHRQLADKFQQAGLVGGRVVASLTTGGHDPAIIFDGKQKRADCFCRSGGGNHFNRDSIRVLDGASVNLCAVAD